MDLPRLIKCFPVFSLYTCSTYGEVGREESFLYSFAHRDFAIKKERKRWGKLEIINMLTRWSCIRVHHRDFPLNHAWLVSLAAVHLPQNWSANHSSGWAPSHRPRRPMRSEESVTRLTQQVRVWETPKHKIKFCPLHICAARLVTLGVRASHFDSLWDHTELTWPEMNMKEEMRANSPGNSHRFCETGRMHTQAFHMTFARMFWRVCRHNNELVSSEILVSSAGLGESW